VALSALTCCQPAQVLGSKDRAPWQGGGVDPAELTEIVERAMEKVPAVGLAVSAAAGPVTAVCCRGTVGGTQVTSRTVMYAASVTKQLIGYLAASAVEQGRLDPRSPARELLPELPPWTAAVQVRHLLHHTSGLPDVTDPSVPGPVDNQEVLRRLGAVTGPTSPAGERYAYNNTGYVLLALLLEECCGEPVADLAQRRIFGPLGISDSRLGGHPVLLPGFPDPPATVGDGGLWTTVVDLDRWLVALNEWRPEPAAVHRIEQPAALDDGSPLDYGWGLRISTVAAGRLVTHGGSWPGWLAKTARVPEQQVAVAVLAHDSEEQAVSRLGADLAVTLATRGVRPAPDLAGPVG
jgi:CubicO group peptidase (beta-lactamase class C family)